MARERCSASPPCLAHEMEDSYAGFLPCEELASALDHLIALAQGKPRTVAWRWISALRPIAEALRAQEETTSDDSALCANAERPDLEEAARALLPQVRDDRIHATLKRLLAEP